MKMRTLVLRATLTLQLSGCASGSFTAHVKVSICDEKKICQTFSNGSIPYTKKPTIPELVSGAVAPYCGEFRERGVSSVLTESIIASETSEDLFTPITGISIVGGPLGRFCPPPVVSSPKK
ncbi:hypothetical protein HZC07_02990 [Candidatus Micrarchaeota archaeon]|nr:hypothetical protein [Candidatus Micrarchaeota archaeon]